jgi:hypothetical protein
MPLEIKVGANIKDAVKSFNQLESQAEDSMANVVSSINSAAKSNVVLAKTLGQLQEQLKRFQAGLKDAGSTDSFARIQRAVDATKQRIDLLNKVNVFQGIKPGADQATQALVNLSRVAQDAPYGFLGIANNINPLLESFQRLKTETGSTKGALSALVSSLSGAGGLGLAVGVVSSLLVVFGDELFGAKNKTESLSKAFDDLAESSNNAVQSVQSLQSILSTVSGFQSLNFKIGGKGQVEFLKEELRSIQILRDEASKNLKAQLNRNLFEETDYFNQSQELRDKIDQQIKQHNDNVTKLQSEMSDWNEKVRLQNLKIQLQEKEDREEADKKAEEASKRALQKAKDRNKEEADAFKRAMAEKIAILTEFQKDFESIGVINLPNLSKTLENFSSDELTSELRSKLQDALLNIPTISTEFQAIDPKKVPIPLKPTIVWQDTEIHKQLVAISEKLTQMVQSLIANSFVGIGEAIGNALSGKSIGDAFQSLFSFIGGAIADLGKQMIALSPVVAALKLAIKSLNPALMLPAGIGLVAIGTVLRNLKPKGFAEGGLAFGPTLGLVGEGIGTSRSNPEVIAPLDKLKKFINPSGGAVVVGGELRLSGRDLVAALTLNQQSQKRNFGR